nr:LysM peptidoglycan-binding domain-containing protein [Psychrobacillus vulpis]
MVEKVEEKTTVVPDIKPTPSIEENTGEETVGEKEQPTKTEKPLVRKYVVKNRDTLFSISIKFYGSRKGETLIKNANNKRSDIVIIGETLVIP